MSVIIVLTDEEILKCMFVMYPGLLLSSSFYKISYNGLFPCQIIQHKHVKGTECSITLKQKKMQLILL